MDSGSGFDFNGGFQQENFNGGFNQNDNSFSGSQFGGGGGGFVSNDGMNGSPTFSQSQQSPSAVKKRDAQSLTPVTIKQLHNCEHRDSKFKLDGKDLAQVTFIGSILSSEQQPTNLNYLIDDGTGKINVRIYIDLEDENHSNHAENTYVRVVGNLREFNNQLSVVGFTLLPITDFNELTFHMLEAISVHLRNTRGEAGGAVGGGAVQQNAAPAMNGGNNYGGGNNFGGNAPAGGNDDGLQQKVLKVFEADSSDQGASIDYVCQQFPNVSRMDIKKAVEYLSDEGHLYSTVDDDHFKSTTSG